MSNLLKLTMILTKAKVADIATRRLLSFGDKMIKTNSKGGSLRSGRLQAFSGSYILERHFISLYCKNL